MAHPHDLTLAPLRAAITGMVRRAVRPLRGDGHLAFLPALVLAQVPNYTITGDGMPGNSFVSTLLSWLGYLALGGALASVMAGGGVWAWGHHTGNGRGATMGRNLVMGGAVGASVIGMAPTLVNLFMQAGSR